VRTVRRGTAIAGGCAVALLAGLDVVDGLGLLGWIVGLAAAGTTNVLLSRGLDRRGVNRVHPPNGITLTRAMLVAGVAALVADGVRGTAHTTAVVLLATLALVLDAVDGLVARRTEGGVTELGARFDMEVDAFLILVLSWFVAPVDGSWVLTIGAARYAYGAAGWVIPWLRSPLPSRYWRKVVAAVQGIVLTVAASQLLPTLAIDLALGIALALLTESFGRDVVWQWLGRRTTAHRRSDIATFALAGSR
jgi:phosphatidylglycerophosphate synthase